MAVDSKRSAERSTGPFDLGAPDESRISRNAFFATRAIRARQNNLPGKSLETLSSPAAKNIRLSPSDKSVI
jgi:hypothetical protein